MARIAIDDSLFRDTRFLKLIVKTGDEYKAAGLFLMACVIAQKYYIKNSSNRLIPTQFWPEELNVLIEIRFAELRENGVYVAGSEKQFSWIAERKEAASKGGKKSAEARKLKRKELESLSLKQKQAKASKGKPISITITNPITNSITKTKTTRKDISQSTEENRKVWDAYKTCYEKKYNFEPARNAKNNALISQLVKRLGPDAIEVVKFFVSHKKSFYVSNMHDLKFCISDAEALRIQWLNGRAVTENDVKKYSKNQEQQDLLDAIERGEV